LLRVAWVEDLFIVHISSIKKAPTPIRTRCFLAVPPDFLHGSQPAQALSSR
jgi:hypothetical protein